MKAAKKHTFWPALLDPSGFMNFNVELFNKSKLIVKEILWFLKYIYFKAYDSFFYIKINNIWYSELQLICISFYRVQSWSVHSFQLPTHPETCIKAISSLTHFLLNSDLSLWGLGFPHNQKNIKWYIFLHDHWLTNTHPSNIRPVVALNWQALHILFYFYIKNDYLTHRKMAGVSHLRNKKEGERREWIDKVIVIIYMVLIWSKQEN